MPPILEDKKGANTNSKIERKTRTDKKNANVNY